MRYFEGVVNVSSYGFKSHRPHHSIQAGAIPAFYFPQGDIFGYALTKGQEPDNMRGQ